MAVRWCKIGDTSEVGRHFCFAGIAGPSEGCTRFGGLMRIWHRETGLWGEKGICWFYYRGKLVASNYILMIKLFLYFIVLSIFWRDLRKLKISERVKELFVRLCVWRLNLGTFPPPLFSGRWLGPTHRIEGRHLGGSTLLHLCVQCLPIMLGPRCQQLFFQTKNRSTSIFRSLKKTIRSHPRSSVSMVTERGSRFHGNRRVDDLSFGDEKLIVDIQYFIFFFLHWKWKNLCKLFR